jgi:hypothetical protein
MHKDQNSFKGGNTEMLGEWERIGAPLPCSLANKANSVALKRLTEPGTSSLCEDLDWFTNIGPSADLVDLVRLMNPDFIFYRFGDVDAILSWLNVSIIPSERLSLSVARKSGLRLKI